MTKLNQPHLLLFLGAVLTWTLVACTAVGPDYHPPQPEMPSQWHEQSAVIISAADQDMRAWWTLFGDPFLDSLVARAAASNQDLRKAETRIREARAQRVLAGATGSINISTSFTRNRNSGNTSKGEKNANLFQAGFDAGWELDIFGGVQRAMEAADASLAASQEDLRNVLVSLEAEVVRNYVELRGNQRRLTVARGNIVTRFKTFELVRGRFQAGLGNELDLVQAQTQLAMTKAQVPALESSTKQSMHQLALLIGLTPESLISELSKEKDIPLIPPQIPISLPSDLLRGRPDIRSAERQLAAATAEIGIATADLFPRFSLTGLLGLQSSNLSDLVTSGSRFWSIGPALKLSVFDQGKARAGIEMRTARRDAALAVYEKTVLTALTETEDALVNFFHEQETRRTLSEAVTSGGRAVTMANGMYETGLVDFLNVLQSEQALSQSQDQLVQSDQRLALNMVAIFKALGGGWKNRDTADGAPISADILPPDMQ